MAASESDFTGIDDDGVGAFLGDEWPPLVRAIKSLTAYFVAKTNAGTEPLDVLTGISFGQGTDHFKWRILGSGGDLLIQENTGTEATPTWTTRTTFGTGGALDHGGLSGLGDDDHTIYTLATGTRTTTGNQTFSGAGGILTNTITERTSATGVTVDGCLIKDGVAADSTLHAGVAETAHSLADGTRAITGSQQFDVNVKTDTIIEKTAATGVTVDSCLIKDGIVADSTLLAGNAETVYPRLDGSRAFTTAAQDFGAGIKTDTIVESGAAAGVTIDGTLIKDNDIKVATITEQSAAAGVTVDGCLIKDGAAANALLLGGTAEASLSVADSVLFNGTADTIYTLLDGSRAHTTAAQDFGAGIKTDTIVESGAGVGVTIDGSLIKDKDLKIATLTEEVAAAGVTIDGCLVKDGSVADSLLLAGKAETVYPLLDGTRAFTGAQTFSHASGVVTDAITEETATAGVTVDTCLIKDGTVADSLLLNGVSTYSRLDVTQEYTKAKGHTEVAVAVATATFTFDFEASNYFEAALSANVTTVTINNTGKPGTRVIKVTQGTAGSKTLTGWPTTVKWVGSTEPVITSAANSIDFITIVVDSAGTMFGFVAQDFG